MTSLAEILTHDGDDAAKKHAAGWRVGYRTKRVTAMLILSSAAAQDVQDPKLHTALAKFRASNFNFDVLDDRTISAIYSYVDSDLATRAAAEFAFTGAWGNIQDLGACVGTCDLCGKGDSRDDGANEDKLRYQYRLINKAGGHDLWVGSSCILHHGLHVDGAATADDARKVLAKTLAQHIRRWKIEAWRLVHPDHTQIPEQNASMMRWRYLINPGAYSSVTLELMFSMLGLDHARLWLWLSKAHKKMKTLTGFYERKAYLTEKKTEEWMAIKPKLADAVWAHAVISECWEKGYVGETAFDFIALKKQERAASRPRRRAVD